MMAWHWDTQELTLRRFAEERLQMASASTTVYFTGTASFREVLWLGAVQPIEIMKCDEM
jgi:hypothetical protein